MALRSLLKPPTSSEGISVQSGWNWFIQQAKDPPFSRIVGRRLTASSGAPVVSAHAASISSYDAAYFFRVGASMPCRSQWVASSSGWARTMSTST